MVQLDAPSHNHREPIAGRQVRVDSDIATPRSWPKLRTEQDATLGTVALLLM